MAKQPLQVTMPVRRRGRRSDETQAQFDSDTEAFCAAIKEIEATLDFKVTNRGWCYVLEEHGLAKGDFDMAQKIINECRKSGLLPIDICAEDETRQAIGLDGASAEQNATTIAEQVDIEIETIENARRNAIYFAGSDYVPKGFWHDQKYYVEMLVEKIDLKELFRPVCERFRVPLTNNKGWGDINSRTAMMRRFQRMEAQGKICVLLYCGDHDAPGLAISRWLKGNMEDLAAAVGWSPEHLIIDRFGLNADFIKRQKLSWVDGLETGKGTRLDDPGHNDHNKPYVQDYIRRFGARKVEANALVVRPEAGRQLCLDAITKYVAADAPDKYERQCRKAQREIKRRVLARLGEEK